MLCHACKPTFKRDIPTACLVSVLQNLGVGDTVNSYIYSEKMIDSIKLHLDYRSKFITSPKFVFLCGKQFSEKIPYFETNRGIIDKFLKSKSKDIYIVLSEQLWEENFNSNIDLLTFEEFLAEVSDCIILFVESPGSFCELGAFSYADKLFSDKLAIIIDQKYVGDKSFIITGPTAKARKDGSDIIYAPLNDTGLLFSDDLREYVERLINRFQSKRDTLNKRKPNSEEDRVSVNSFIIELLELVKILQPVSNKDLLEIYKSVKGFSHFEFTKRDGSQFHNNIKYEYIIKLLKSVGLITIENNCIRTNKYYNTQPFMFRSSRNLECRERGRLLCRKYRYKGNV